MNITDYHILQIIKNRFYQLFDDGYLDYVHNIFSGVGKDFWHTDDYDISLYKRRYSSLYEIAYQSVDDIFDRSLLSIKKEELEQLFNSARSRYEIQNR